ncbi:MAG: glycosyltransferase [Anaerolineae bacterium]|nr:glycosyltransferase [Anaerolineae bacterium]
MRITILAIGSRGDVQPLVALGAGLRRTGHQVRIAAGDEFEALAANTGLRIVWEMLSGLSSIRMLPSGDEDRLKSSSRCSALVTQHYFQRSGS